MITQPLYQMRASVDGGLTWRVQFLWTDINEAHRYAALCQRFYDVGSIRSFYTIIEHQ